MAKTFTQAELLKLSEDEKTVQKQMGSSNGREDVARAAQFKSEQVSLMWQRVLLKIRPATFERR